MLEPVIAAKRPWTSPTVTVLPFRATASGNTSTGDGFVPGFSTGTTGTTSTTGVCLPLPGLPIGRGSSRQLLGVKDGTGDDNHCAPARTVAAPS